MNGFDTPQALPGDLGDMKFAIKYCANSGTFPNKRLTHAERTQCVAAGVKNGFVFEKSDQPSYFTASQGAQDAAAAIAYFNLLGVPAGIPCFYAIDFDAAPGDVIGYARAFHLGFEDSGYLTGVYGSGNICEYLVSEGYAHFSWLANASGWSGFDWDGWDIKQGSGSVPGINSDPDECRNEACLW